MNVRLDNLECPAFLEETTYHALVFFELDRAGRIDQPAAAGKRSGPASEQLELSVGQPTYIGRSQAPLDLRVLAQRPCPGARRIDQDPIKSRCRLDEWKITRRVQRHGPNGPGAERLANRDQRGQPVWMQVAGNNHRLPGKRRDMRGLGSWRSA